MPPVATPPTSAKVSMHNPYISEHHGSNSLNGKIATARAPNTPRTPSQAGTVLCPLSVTSVTVSGQVNNSMASSAIIDCQSGSTCLSSSPAHSQLLASSLASSLESHHWLSDSSSSDYGDASERTCYTCAITTTLYGVITSVRAEPIHQRNGPSSGMLDRQAVGEPLFRYVHNDDMPVLCRSMRRAMQGVIRCAVRWAVPSADSLSGLGESQRWHWVWLTLQQVNQQMICVVRQPQSSYDSDEQDADVDVLSIDAANAKRRRDHWRRHTYNGLGSLVLNFLFSSSDEEANSEVDLHHDEDYDEEDEDEEAVVIATATVVSRSPVLTATVVQDGGAITLAYRDSISGEQNLGTPPLSATESMRSSDMECPETPTEVCPAPIATAPRRTLKFTSPPTTRVIPPASLLGALVGWAGAAIGDAVLDTVHRYTPGRLWYPRRTSHSR